MASDVYSLGVVLYELLTGCGPYPETTSPDCLEPLAWKAAPARPIEAEGLGRAGQRKLCGDLDAIVLKALESDRRRRYPTAGHLGDDLKNFLRRRPVRARDGGKLYVAAKLLSRHRWAAAVGTAIVLALGALAVSLEIENRRLARELEEVRKALGDTTELPEVVGSSPPQRVSYGSRPM